ncbi:nuclear transport factor 2 family protein [Aestuariicella hydrocarbonica]|uniref:Nuclear transport factor 2 family protein n=1 Tax=Pseudomaricurvus hydrocarbonicus TaxID=1470433 RepID=A0A9E5MKK6_9GAMM|nr:nuclear transport factor 2 family protein [Aestuariicella hydrocarbonica]NHO66669.1 nuclear transport factor 2 family protein [Aestuariicella hydrocarbonica]
MSTTDNSIEHFMHRQIECWNAGDKQGFLQCYRDIASTGLDIEYVGMDKHDPWLMLEGMWQQQPHIRIEVKESIIIGNEGAAHHINHLVAGGISTETIEFYSLQDGKLSSRIFIKPA